MTTARSKVLPQGIAWWMCVLVVVSLLSLSNAVESLNFAIQVDPIAFLQEPVSTVALVGSSFQLTCRIRVKPLISGYPPPQIFWRHNNSEVTSVNSRFAISKDVSTGLSTLIVSGAQFDDAGVYQCEARDGRLRDGRWRYITVSKRAAVEVISSTVFNRTVKTGEPLLLSCGTNLYSNVTLRWFYNNATIFLTNEQRWTQLSNGSLLVYSAAVLNSGEWRCERIDRQGRNTTISITTVWVTQEPYSGPPVVIIDPPSSPTSQGAFTVRCLTAPDPKAPVAWLSSPSLEDDSSGIDISNNSSHELQFDMFNSSHSGQYTCELRVNGQVIAFDSTRLTVTALPNITTAPLSDVHIPQYFSSIPLTCSAQGYPTPTIHWLKDGQPLNRDLYNNVSGILQVNKSDVDDRLYGVYQCIAENSVGMSYANFRVLYEGYANPPGQVNCSVRESSSNNAMFTISWSPPVLTGQGALRYQVKYEYYQENSFLPTTGTVPEFFEKNTANFEIFDPHGIVRIFVRLYRSENGPEAVCLINAALRFVRNPNPLTLNFANGTGTVSWLFYPVDGFYSPRKIEVVGFCVYGKDVLKFNGQLSEVASARYEVHAFTGLHNGTVCHFSGSYILDIAPAYSLYEEDNKKFSVYQLPTSTGHVTTPLKLSTVDGGEYSVALGLACRNSTVELLWTGSRDSLMELESLNITGICINTSSFEQQHSVWMNKDDIAMASGPLLLSISGVESATLCGFTGIALEKRNATLHVTAPVQCIVDVYSPNFTLRFDVTMSSSQPLPVFSTSIATSTTMSPIAASTTTVSPGISQNSGTAVAVSTSVTLSVLLVVSGALALIMILLCTWRKYNRATQHFEAVIFKDALENQITITIGDNVSVKTDIQPLDSTEYYELNCREQANSDTVWSPKLIRGNDSGCILEQLVLPSKLDHTGSSGYGSSYTPDSLAGSSTNYHETIAQDLPVERGSNERQLKIVREDSVCSLSPAKSISFSQTDIIADVEDQRSQSVFPLTSYHITGTSPSSPLSLDKGFSSSLPLTCSHCHSEVPMKLSCQDSCLESASDEVLSQSSDISDVNINCLKCDTCGHNNCVYKDEKGYIRFKLTAT